jgi:hypothetical protein
MRTAYERKSPRGLSEVLSAGNIAVLRVATRARLEKSRGFEIARAT